MYCDKYLKLWIMYCDKCLTQLKLYEQAQELNKSGDCKITMTATNDNITNVQVMMRKNRRSRSKHWF
jgi:hypothetical protein